MRRDRRRTGSARTVGVGAGLLALLIAVGVWMYLVSQTAETTMRSRGNAQRQLQQLQRTLDTVREQAERQQRRLDALRGGTGEVAATTRPASAPAQARPEETP